MVHFKGILHKSQIERESKNKEINALAILLNHKVKSLLKFHY